MAGNIVEEWHSNGPKELPFVAPFSVDKEAILRAAADANRIERPKGHTVSFHYNAEIEGFHFGKTHPMKPWRLQLTKQLIISYGLHYAMDLHKTHMASKEEIALFHSEDYLSFLET